MYVCGRQAWADKEGIKVKCKMFESLAREINASYGIEHTSAWANRYWWVPVLSVLTYLTLVATGKAWMEKRPAYSMRGVMFVWNVFLALYSIAGAVVMVPPLWHELLIHGFQHTMCYTTIHYVPLQSLFSALFVVSKIIEFGDTFFVITRKTPLMFLHWYHHATVCIYSWHSLAISSAPAHWYCALNYSVHSIMYSYYVVKSTGFRMLPGVAIGVTMLQLLQFVLGLMVNCTTLYIYVIKGQFCRVDSTNLAMGTTIYFSFLILFGKFFFERYISPKKKVKKVD